MSPRGGFTTGLFLSEEVIKVTQRQVTCAREAVFGLVKFILNKIFIKRITAGKIHSKINCPIFFGYTYICHLGIISRAKVLKPSFYRFYF